jgi:excisionase family DNA binding protein
MDATGTYLTADELGVLLNLTPRTVRKRVKTGKYPHWGSGRTLRFSPEHVAAIKALDDHPAQAAPAPPTFDLMEAARGIQRRNRHAA